MINNKLKDKIEIELKRASGTLYDDNRNLELNNLGKLNLKAKLAIESQVKKLDELLGLKEKTVSIEQDLAKNSNAPKFRNPGFNELKNKFNPDILNSIIHGRIREQYNEELDYTSHSYVILNQNYNEFNYSKSVINSLLTDELINQRSAEQLENFSRFTREIKRASNDIEEDSTYMQAKASVAFNVSSSTEELGESKTEIEGIIYRNKEGQNVFSFVNPYQDYYSETNDGVITVSVDDPRISNILIKKSVSDYIIDSDRFQEEKKYVHENIDKSNPVYKQVTAAIAYTITGGDLDGESRTNIEGLIFTDKKGDDIFVFIDPYQNYYSKNDTGLKVVSVGDERISDIQLSNPKYSSLELDASEKELIQRKNDFQNSFVEKFLPIHNERNDSLLAVNNQRRTILSTKNDEARKEARLQKVKAFEDNTEKMGNELLENYGARFKDAKVGTFFTQRDDIEYSFLVEVGKGNKKETFEIAIPKDAIRPFEYDSRDDTLFEESHVNITLKNKDLNEEPTSGVPVVYSEKGNLINNYFENDARGKALNFIISKFEDIALYNSEQYSQALDNDNSHKTANKNPPSVEENKVGLINELNSYLKSSFEHDPKAIEKLSDYLKKQGSGLKQTA